MKKSTSTTIAAFVALVLGLVIIAACGTFISQKINGWWSALDVFLTYMSVNILINCGVAIWKAVKREVEKL